MASISTSFQGFGSFTPVLPSGPAAPYVSPPEGSSSDSEKSSKKSGSGVEIGGLDSEMVKQLYKEGLASDVEAFLTLMEGAIMNAYNPITGKANLAAYKLLLPKLAQVKQEKELFNKAMDSARQNNALDEVAINVRGEVYVVDPSHGIINKSAAEVTASDRILTNGEIAKMRATNPAIAFDMDLTNTIANGISVENITKYITDTISKLGKTSAEENLYVNANGEVLQGAELLRQMLSNTKGSGVFEIDSMSESLKALARKALSYIKSTLPSNMLSVLQVKANLSNSTPDALIDNLVFSTVDEKTKNNINIKNVGGSGSNGQSDNMDKINMDPEIMFALGRTPSIQYTLNPGTSYEFKGIARVGVATNAKGEGLPSGSSLADLLTSRFRGQLDLHNATFGGAKIDSPDVVRFMDNALISMELPIDTNAPSGVIRPNIDLLEKMKVADQYIKDNNIKDVATINKVYLENQLPPLFNADGTPNRESYARFAVMQGYVDTDNAFEAVDAAINENLVNRPSQLSEGSILRMFASLGKQYDFDFDNIRVGQVYIPMLDISNGYYDSILGAFQTSGSSVNLGQLNQIMDLSSLTDAARSKDFKPAGSWTAFNNQ